MYYCLPVFLGGQRRLDESLPGEKYTVNIACRVYDLRDRLMQVLSADSQSFYAGTLALTLRSLSISRETRFIDNIHQTL